MVGVMSKEMSGKSTYVFKNAGEVEKDSYKFVGSKEEIDRDGDIVILEGIDFKNFINNPVVLWGHDSRSTPVGKVLSVMIDKVTKEAIFEIEFAETEKGQEIESLVKQGILNATSIGFIVKDWDYDDDLGAYLFRETELLEISLVNIPANPAALSKKEVKQEKSLSREEITSLIAAAVAEAMVPVEEPVAEPKEEPKVNTPDEVLEPVGDPEPATGGKKEEVEPEKEEQQDISTLLERILEALEQKPKENMEPDSQDQENPKEPESSNQQTDDDSSDKNPDEDHSDDSPDDTEDDSDDVNLVTVEDLEEDTEFSVIL